jgi:hypothetical protein
MEIHKNVINHRLEKIIIYFDYMYIIYKINAQNGVMLWHVPFNWSHFGLTQYFIVNVWKFSFLIIRFMNVTKVSQQQFRNVPDCVLCAI